MYSTFECVQQYFKTFLISFLTQRTTQLNRRVAQAATTPQRGHGRNNQTTTPRAPRAHGAHIPRDVWNALSPDEKQKHLRACQAKKAARAGGTPTRGASKVAVAPVEVLQAVPNIATATVARVEPRSPIGVGHFQSQNVSVVEQTQMPSWKKPPPVGPFLPSIQPEIDEH
jgi:hypothetical protein